MLHVSMGRVVLQMEGASFLSVGGAPVLMVGVFEKTHRMGRDPPPLPPLWKTLSTEINNNYSTYIVFHSEALLRKSKESNNYGIKVQVK